MVSLKRYWVILFDPDASCPVVYVSQRITGDGILQATSPYAALMQTIEAYQACDYYKNWTTYSVRADDDANTLLLYEYVPSRGPPHVSVTCGTPKPSQYFE